MSEPIYATIESCPDYVKDTTTGAILNTNRSAMEAYRHQKKMSRKLQTDHERINQLEEKLSNMEELLEAILRKL